MAFSVSTISGMRLSLDSFRFLATAIAGWAIRSNKNLVRYLIFFGFEWSRRRDLNPRPSDYKSDALPTELRRRSGKMERGTGIEPATNSVEGCDSTVELPPPLVSVV